MKVYLKNGKTVKISKPVVEELIKLLLNKEDEKNVIILRDR